VLNDKNLHDHTQYTMTIEGSRKLFEELPLNDLKKENWTYMNEQGWFFYRTK
jgi:hypothetical protein